MVSSGYLGTLALRYVQPNAGHARTIGNMPFMQIVLGFCSSSPMGNNDGDNDDDDEWRGLGSVLLFSCRFRFRFQDFTPSYVSADVAPPNFCFFYPISLNFRGFVSNREREKINNKNKQHV